MTGFVGTIFTLVTGCVVAIDTVNTHPSLHTLLLSQLKIIGVEPMIYRRSWPREAMMDVRPAMRPPVLSHAHKSAITLII